MATLACIGKINWCCSASPPNILVRLSNNFCWKNPHFWNLKKKNLLLFLYNYFTFLGKMQFLKIRCKKKNRNCNCRFLKTDYFSKVSSYWKYVSEIIQYYLYFCPTLFSWKSLISSKASHSQNMWTIFSWNPKFKQWLQSSVFDKPSLLLCLRSKQCPA